VRADAADDELPSEHRLLPEPEAPRFTRPTKVKLSVSLLHGPHRYEAGATVELPAGTASWVVENGYGKPA
jgi:hypothetical protein